MLQAKKRKIRRTKNKNRIKVFKKLKQLEHTKMQNEFKASKNCYSKKHHFSLQLQGIKKDTNFDVIRCFQIKLV